MFLPIEGGADGWRESAGASVLDDGVPVFAGGGSEAGREGGGGGGGEAISPTTLCLQ